MLAACDDDEPEPEPEQGAALQLAFEEIFDSPVPLELTATQHADGVGFAPGPTGQALESFGEGGWLEYSLAKPLDLPGSWEIAFNFKRADWVNPYSQGSGAQTIVTVSGITQGGWSYISFGINVYTEPYFYMSWDSDGGSHLFPRSPGEVPLSLAWHKARLAYDAEKLVATLWLDSLAVGSIKADLSRFSHSIKRVKFGTWHEKNQAYKGLVDNFVIRQIAD